jgi:hypothetical protein
MQCQPPCRNIIRSAGENMTQTAGEILPNAARRYGNRTVLIVNDRTFSYHELDRLSVKGIFSSSLGICGDFGWFLFDLWCGTVKCPEACEFWW